MADVTILLNAARNGDTGAADKVVALLYAELHRLAHSRMRRSGEMTLLDTTSLVHEAYLRLQRMSPIDFPDRRYFLGYAAKVMRGIVVDAMRARSADRHGGQAMHVTLNTEVAESVGVSGDQVLQVHEALEQLASVDERMCKVVEMRYFGGLSEAEIADCLGVTERTVQRDWQKARLLLAESLR